MYVIECHVQDVLNFGRSGAGAPVRDSQGQVKAVVVGNPEIRFQENEGVQKSIHNAIRYHADKDFKSAYHAELEQQIQQRDDKAQQVRDQDVTISRQLEVLPCHTMIRFLKSIFYYR